MAHLIMISTFPNSVRITRNLAVEDVQFRKMCCNSLLVSWPNVTIQDNKNNVIRRLKIV